MRVDHIGYAVKDMERARKAFEALGYVFEDIVVDEARNVYICFGEDDSQRIELVSPISQGSPVDEVLNKMGGGNSISYLLSSIVARRRSKASESGGIQGHSSFRSGSCLSR